MKVLFKRNVVGLILLWLVIIVLSLSPGPVYGFDDEHDTGHPEGSQGTFDGRSNSTTTSNRNQSQGADPVILSTGDFVDTYQDFQIKGRIPLEITRKYHSQNKYNGPFGHGWNFNYNMSLVETVDWGAYFDPNAGVTNDINKVIIRAGNSIRLVFTAIGSSSFTPPPGRFESLEREGEGFVFKEKSGTKYHFNNDGWMTFLEDRHGNRLTMAYDSGGKLTSVTDDADRSLTFTYNATNKIQTITDPAGRTVSYSYDAHDNLIEVTDPVGYKTTFAYDLEHRLISITDARGYLYLSNVYDNLNRVVSQIYKGGTFTNVYDTSNNVTTVTDRKGVVTEYYMNSTGNVVKVVNDVGGLNITATQTYDKNMNLISETDPKGNTTSFTYDAEGNLLTLTDAKGNVTTFTYEPVFNQIAGSEDALGTINSFEYDSKGNLTKITDALGNETSFTYDTNGDLLTTTDANDHTTNFSYNAYGSILSITDALGNRTDLSYDPVGNITTLTECVSCLEERTTTFTYDNLNRPLTITNAAGGITRYTYDELGNMVSVENPIVQVTTSEYDEKNRLISVQNSIGGILRYTYDLNGNRRTSTDALNQTTTFDYDALERLVKTTDVLNGERIYGYNENGNLTSITDARGNTTTFSYNELNQLVEKINPLNQSTTYTYDERGKQKTITDAKEQTVTYTYNQLNRLTQITDPEGGQKTYAYDNVGNCVAITDRMGNTTQYQYDSKDRMIKTIDPLLNENTATYDFYGNILTSTDAIGATTTYEYDSIDRLVKKINPLGHETVYTYDAVGSLISRTDANGNTITYEYDLPNRVTKAIDPLNNTTTLAYDGNGNMLSVTDVRGQITAFTYDGLNRQVSVTNPLGEQETYAYDNNGNMTRKTLSNGDTITYTYDALNQLTQKVLDNGGTTSYTYDAVGNLTGITNPYSALSFDHDGNNRRISAHVAATVYQPVETTISYAYDANGNRQSMTDTLGGLVGYTYDEQNNLATLGVGGQNITFSYDENNRRLSKTFPNNLTSVYAYNSTGDLTSLNHSLGANPISQHGYQYDSVGNITVMSNPAGDHDYTYDKLNQLLQADHPVISTEDYTYDPVGNRLSSANEPTWSYSAGNRLLNDGTFTYQYTNGCLTQKTNTSSGEITTYSYNSENQLTGITTPGSTVSYYYDGLGRRICKEVDGVKTHYVYDEEDILVVLDNSHAVTARYIHGPGIDEPIQLDQGGTLYYYLLASLETITQIVDSAGNIQQEYTYDSFGNIINTAGTLDDPYTYTGREYDPESGLYFYRFRYYDPQAGRFLQEDPVGFFSRDTNLYRYVWNNPLVYVDPFGLNPSPTPIMDANDPAVQAIQYPRAGAQAAGMVGHSRTGNAALRAVDAASEYTQAYQEYRFLSNMSELNHAGRDVNNLTRAVRNLEAAEDALMNATGGHMLEEVMPDGSTRSTRVYGQNLDEVAQAGRRARALRALGHVGSAMQVAEVAGHAMDYHRREECQIARFSNERDRILAEYDRLVQEAMQIRNPQLKEELLTALAENMQYQLDNVTDSQVTEHFMNAAVFARDSFMSFIPAPSSWFNTDSE
ncbi:RHS repeat-associated core domain-containing protein [Thermodesulfobacteriota bacterium]